MRALLYYFHNTVNEVVTMKPMVSALMCAALGLAACDAPADPPEKGADVAVIAANDQGRRVFEASADGGTGAVTVSTPGFDLNLKLPKMALGADDFDIDGVKLYPGSTIGTIRVDAGGKDRKGDAAVDVGFTAPADARTVAGWFARRFAEKGIAFERDGDTLTGETGDGDAFVIELADETVDGAAGAKGSIHLVSG
ncbi:MAG: hypothetical protein H3C60_04920 [Sphingomonadaceae bacterium]|nr:hypothetical protein [Sphingomonadaceae bacterium]